MHADSATEAHLGSSAARGVTPTSLQFCVFQTRFLRYWGCPGFAVTTVRENTIFFFFLDFNRWGCCFFPSLRPGHEKVHFFPPKHSGPNSPHLEPGGEKKKIRPEAAYLGLQFWTRVVLQKVLIFVVPVLLSAHSSARCSFHTSSWKRCFSKRPAWELTPHSFTLVLHGSEWLDFVLFKKLLFLVTVLSCFKWDYKEKQVVDYYNAVYRINKPWNAEFLFSVISCGLFFVVFFLKWPV